MVDSRPWHESPKKASQNTNALERRIRLNQSGSNPVPLHTWIARHVVSWLPDRAAIVDLGCGTGLLGAALHEELSRSDGTIGNYHGIDPADTHRDAFVTNAPCDSLLSQLRIGDWLEGRSRYDLVAAVFSLYYHEADDLEWLLRSLVSRLTPSGRLVIVGPVDGNNLVWFQRLEKEVGVAIPERVFYESCEYMNDVMRVASRIDCDVRVRRYFNNVPMTREEVRQYWRSVIYHEEEHDARFDEVFDDGFTISKEVMFIEVKPIV